jgi:hypothetical protein
MLGNLLDPRIKFVKGSSMKWMNAEDAEFTHLLLRIRQFKLNNSTERLFSTAGLTITKERSRLTPDIAGALIFTRSVWEILDNS